MTTIKDVLQYASMFDKCAIDNVPYDFNLRYKLRPQARHVAKIGLRFTCGECVNSMSYSKYINVQTDFKLDHVIDFDDIPEFLRNESNFMDDGTGVDELI